MPLSKFTLTLEVDGSKVVLYKKECEEPVFVFHGDKDQIGKRLEYSSYLYKKFILKDTEILENELNSLIIAKLSW